jgi:hypothetical protein
LFTDKLLNVVTPLTALSVVVPLSVPPPGLLPRATVTEALLFPIRLPPASSTFTVTAGVIEEPAVVLVGCCAKTNFVAGPVLKVTVIVWDVLFIVNLHVVLPLVHPETIVYAGTVQVPIVDGLVGVAVRVTVSVLPNKPLLHFPLATPPVSVQLRVPFPPLDVTVPLPVLEKAIATVLLSVKLV